MNLSKHRTNCNYSSIKVIPTSAQLLNNDRIKVNLSGSQCMGAIVKFCVFEYLSKNQTNINLTLVSVNYEGFTTTDCRFGGIATFDGAKHVLDICSNYGTNTPARNIYSTQHKLIISVYSFSEYSSITGNLQVSAAKCNTVNVDFCKVATFCDGDIYATDKAHS